MSFPAYERYKESGVEWLGRVPSHWAVTSFKRISALEMGQSPSSEDCNQEGSGLPFLQGCAEFGTSHPTPKQYCEVPPKTCLAGDLLISVRAPVGAINIADQPYGIGRGLCAIRASRLDRDFLKYAVISQVDQLTSVATGSTYLAVTVADVGDTKLVAPPVAEQRAIAAFLDRETTKIDALVEAQERLIALLKEKRQAVIFHAVTKGLDPSAPMKDSGVEWLGQVPAHWEVTALKRLCTLITDGAHISPETENGVYCFVSTRDVSQAGIDFDGCLRTSEASYEYLYRTGCQPEVGDVLFSKDGTIGRTVVVREHRDFVVASSLIIIRPNREVLDAEFLDFLCQSDAIQDQVESFVKGAGLPRLSIANLMRVIGIFPPIHEQRLIATSLAGTSVRFTALIAEAEAAIALLQERRAALISAAVTGKIDVRGLIQTAEAA